MLALCGAGSVCLCVLALGAGSPPAKVQMHNTMRSLASQIEALAPQAATDPEAAAQMAQLQTTYDQISGALGGDDPGYILDVRYNDTQPAGADGIAGDGAAGGSPFPPNCPGDINTYTNSTPVAIPTGPAVVSSTLAVAGAGPIIADVNVSTFITHTFAADLDITIASPGGTVVTLTTDNGGANDNVFNGTVWDDSANPGGQVPYTSNNGLVTDHTYVNLTLASPLVPEEALGAFIGENPNGTWTITISDDLGGDGGSLASWALTIATLSDTPVTAATSATNNTPTAIPTGPAVVSSTLAVSGAGSYLCDVNLTTSITHTFAADLDITLQSPGGTVVTLTTDNGGANDNVFNGTVWDDDANPLGQVPYTSNNGLVTDHTYVNLTLASPLVVEEALAAFIGENPNGTWTITISDDLGGDGGSLASWTLDLVTCFCVPQGACCFASGACQDLTEANCDQAGGEYQGDGTNCDSVVCIPTGACCVGPTCLENLSENECLDQGGVFQGIESVCAGVICQIFGGCCLPDGSCAVLTEDDCNAAGGSYLGDDTDCTDTEPPVVTTGGCINIWPPNHKHWCFTLADCASATDGPCGNTLDVNASGSIISICSDEPEDVGGGGDGHTVDDIVISGPSSFCVRAERQGAGNGRVYTITFVVSDAAGNNTMATCQVCVPHDQGPNGGAVNGPGPGYCEYAGGAASE
jgi:subtilisin-like proprotein convertase family protein